MSLRIRRGLSNEIPGPQEGELLYTTDTGKLYVGYNDDGSIVPRIVGSTIQDDDTPSLGGNLDLNGNDIVGTGNIDIDGYITATGNINLGDGSEDNVIVGGVISSSLIPSEDGRYDLGTDANRWRNGFFEGLDVDGEIISNSVVTNTIINNDSSVLYDGETQTLNAIALEAQTISGDLSGSVFGEDSSLIVDATSSSLLTDGITIQDTNIILTNGFELDIKGSKIVQQEWYGVDTTILNAARLSQVGARGTAENTSSVQVGDYIATLAHIAFSNDEDKLKSAIATSIDTATGTNDLPGKLEILIEDYDGNLVPPFSIDSRGTVYGQTLKTGSYADETERDSLIPNPEAGMIIFLSGHDDSSGSPKFQGYNGTNWVDFF